MIFISANKAIDTMVKIMPEGKSKAKVVFLLNDSTFLYIYNIKTTTTSQFTDPRLFYDKNFQANTSVVVEVQIYPQNFMPKRSVEYICRYLFKQVGIYSI